MRLTVGQAAPDFRAVDIFGQTRSLADYRGRHLFLTFHRYSTCALCNLRIHEMIGSFEAYRDQGLEMIAVFESPAARVAENVNRQSVPFPLVGDPEGVLYDLYGVENSEEKVLAPPRDAERRVGLIGQAAALGYPLQREEGGNFFRLPADFVIDPRGFVAAAFYSEEIGTHLAFEDIDAILRYSQQTVS